VSQFEEGIAVGWKARSLCAMFGRMTWEVYEKVNWRRRELRRQLSDEAIRRLERKGLAVRNKSAVEVKKLIAATFSSHRHRPHAWPPQAPTRSTRTD
jgi:hypothetical protein